MSNENDALDPRIAQLVAGNCGVLALEIHRLTGWPMVGLLDRAAGEINLLDEHYRLVSTLPGAIKHVFVRIPDGRCIDGHGAAGAPDLNRFHFVDPIEHEVSELEVRLSIHWRQLGDDEAIKEFTHHAAATLVSLAEKCGSFSEADLAAALSN